VRLVIADTGSINYLVLIGEVHVLPLQIHPGEAAAIDLAVSLHADLLLIDDRAGVNLARQKGLRVTGTLGVLDLAGTRELLDFKQAIESLRSTTFRFPEASQACTTSRVLTWAGKQSPVCARRYRARISACENR
jgi:hypothetical protein